MSVIFLFAFFFVSLLIVLLVLLQEGKGGGLTGMSTGMDGVMGARNPLRRMTAYLFVVFILMAIGINWYFHESDAGSLPVGAEIPEALQVLEQDPLPGATVIPDPGSLAPSPEFIPPAEPIVSLRPEPEEEAEEVEAEMLRPPAEESLEQDPGTSTPSESSVSAEPAVEEIQEDSELEAGEPDNDATSSTESSNNTEAPNEESTVVEEQASTDTGAAVEQAEGVE